MANDPNPMCKTQFCRVVGAFRGGAPPPAYRRGDSKASKLLKAASKDERIEVRPLAADPKSCIPTRRMYRVSRKDVVTEQLKCASINTQGLSVFRLDNRVKFAGLLSEARRGNWHVTFVTDLHQISRSESPDDVLVVCLEEFVLMAWGKVRILLSPPMVKAWRLASSSAEPSSPHYDPVLRSHRWLSGQAAWAIVQSGICICSYGIGPAR